MVFSDFRHDDPFRRYSRSKSKVVKNCADFGQSVACNISLLTYSTECFLGFFIHAYFHIRVVNKSTASSKSQLIVRVSKSYLARNRGKSIKVESCQKLRRILDVFLPSRILGGRPSENWTRVVSPTLQHVDWKKFHEDTPTRPEVIVAHTLNFRPNFKFSRLKFFFGGGPRPSWGVR